MAESDLLKSIRIDWTSSGGRLFRNNVGTGWTGAMIRVPEGVLLRNPRPLRAGLVRGSSDLIGWTCVEITPDMVGRTVAVFTAIEGKTGKVQTTDEQINFLRAVANAGGVARVARDRGDGIVWEMPWV